MGAKITSPHYQELYKRWSSMHQRCYDVNFKSYSDYGERGIKVCDVWQRFFPFYEWAIEYGFQPDLMLERKETNGDYSPENCCWTTRSIQNNNKRNCRLITAFGETKTATAWSKDERCRVHYTTVLYRLSGGWPHEKLLTTPPTR